MTDFGLNMTMACVIKSNKIWALPLSIIGTNLPLPSHRNTKKHRNSSQLIHCILGLTST
jgi:hypothetical protein